MRGILQQVMSTGEKQDERLNSAFTPSDSTGKEKLLTYAKGW